MAIAFDCICGRHFLDGATKCLYCGTTLEENTTFMRKSVELGRIRIRLHEKAKEWKGSADGFLRAARELLRIKREFDNLEAEIGRGRFDLENTMSRAQNKAKWNSRKRKFFGSIKNLLTKSAALLPS